MANKACGHSSSSATCWCVAQVLPLDVGDTDLPLGEDSSFEQAVERVYGQALNLLLKKHHDYGPKNISASPGGPLNGLRVRMWDKLARINNLTDAGVEPSNESLRDSFVDLLNYSAIALLVLDGHWPE